MNKDEYYVFGKLADACQAAFRWFRKLPPMDLDVAERACHEDAPVEELGLAVSLAKGLKKSMHKERAAEGPRDRKDLQHESGD